jgi:hypothetical protein
LWNVFLGASCTLQPKAVIVEESTSYINECFALALVGMTVCGNRRTSFVIHMKKSPASRPGFNLRSSALICG